jgi:hypothetical protein
LNEDLVQMSRLLTASTRSSGLKNHLRATHGLLRKVIYRSIPGQPDIGYLRSTYETLGADLYINLALRITTAMISRGIDFLEDSKSDRLFKPPRKYLRYMSTWRIYRRRTWKNVFHLDSY